MLSPRPLCTLLLALAALSAAAAENRGGRLSFRPDGSFELAGAGETLSGRFFVYSDAAKANLPLAFRVDGDQVAFHTAESRGGIAVAGHDRLFEFTGSITNTSDAELRLEPALAVTAPRTAAEWFWGGFDVLEAGGEALARRGMKGKTSKHIGGGLNQPFPTAALIGPKRAVILGQHQFDDVSYHAAQYRPTGGGRAELTFSQRIVVAPGRTVPFRFAAGIVPVRFGREENVVQAFYDAFPERWRPRQKEDDAYIWGAHSQYRAWYFKPDRERERRFYATVDWSYAPYKRSGDHYGREELWNYETAFPISPRNFAATMNGTVFDYRTITVPEFQRRRREIFRRHARDFGYGFYINAAWCEIGLAKERYPDAINEDTEGGIPHILGPWSTAHDREIRVFPLGSSFGEVLRRDIRQLYEELQFPGFSMDCGTPGVSYRGPAAQNPELPGRAWDEKGIFIDELVAINHVIDFMHGLNPENPPFVWKNGQGRGDYMMIETSIFNPIFRSWMPLTRYNIGQRPAVVHGPGFLVDSTVPDWRNLSRDEFYERMSRLGDHAVLTDFQYGFTQNHVTQSGNPQSIYAMPELLECIRTGWQALVPVEADSSNKLLYRARYGRGADTILYYGNPWPEPMPLTFRVDNAALGGGHHLFVRKMRDRARLENRLAGGDTVFDAVLPSRRPALFESVLKLSALPAGGELAATVESAKDIDRIAYTVTLANRAAFRAAVTPRRLYNFSPEVKLNGAAVPAGETLTLPPGARLELVYTSKYFRTPAASIRDFPFVDAAGAPAFQIRVPAAPNAAEMKEAANLQLYFRFTADKGITQAGKIFVEKNDDAPADPAVVIRVGRGGEAGIRRDGDVIVFNAPEAKQAAGMMKLLAYVMDERFPYLLPFAPHDSISGEMMEKFELASRPLPYEKCFESREAAQ